MKIQVMFNKNELLDLVNIFPNIDFSSLDLSNYSEVAVFRLTFENEREKLHLSYFFIIEKVCKKHQPN